MRPQLKLKSSEDIDKIAASGKILARALALAAKEIRPGISTVELDKIAEQEILRSGAKPSFKGYAGHDEDKFPSALCISINDVVVHGMPSPEIVLREGDIVGLDLGVDLGGFYSDGAITVMVGKVSPLAERLVKTAKRALDAAIAVARVGKRIGDISYAIQKTSEEEGFAVVRDLIGHGVGYAVHEEPAVPCFGKPGTGLELAEGMVLAIEPMLTAGDYKLRTKPGEWPVRTADGSLSAHFEHTVAITKAGPRTLTL
ncbi:MAG: type I methionyl aminopeptidase [Candidatus Liptonbacteria bacterium]